MPQPDDEFTATQALKRYAPFWGRVRDTLTPKLIVGLLVAGIGTSITAIVQFRLLRTDVTALKETFKASSAQGEEIAALKARVDHLDELERERRALIDKTYKELPDPRRLPLRAVRGR